METVLSPRSRLLKTATRLFYSEGIHMVPVDKLVTEAKVTRATFYRHFPAKEDLVVAYLRAKDAELRVAVEAAAGSAAKAEAVLAVLDLIGDSTCSPGFRGCHFINAAAEYPDPSDPVRLVVAEHRNWLSDTLTQLAIQAGHADPAYAASALVLLHDGALSGGELDDPQAVRATLRRVVRDLFGA
jgi:AcrR family transcriptional regulator